MATAKLCAADTRRARCKDPNRALGRLGPSTLASASRPVLLMLQIPHGSCCDVVAA